MYVIRGVNIVHSPEGNFSYVYNPIISNNKQCSKTFTNSIGKIYIHSAAYASCAIAIFQFKGFVIRKTVECEIDTAIHKERMLCFPLFKMMFCICANWTEALGISIQKSFDYNFSIKVLYDEKWSIKIWFNCRLIWWDASFHAHLSLDSFKLNQIIRNLSRKKN